MTASKKCEAAGLQNESARDAWIHKALSEIPAGSRILDAGAGEQRYRESCRHLNYVSQDFAQYDGAGDGAGLQTGSWKHGKLDIVCDITAIPEPAESFDAILCTEVLEHLPDPIAAIQELARLLRRGGRLILTAPFCSLTHFAPYHFATGFNRYFYETHLPQNGLKIVEATTNGNFFEYLAQETRRIGSVAKQYAGIQPNLLEKVAAKVLLGLLQRLSARDQGSAELLNFGYFILAVKP